MNTPQAASAGATDTASGAEAAAELRCFLELGAAQLDAAVRESDARVDKLAQAITAMATDAHTLGLEVQVLEGSEPARVRQACTRMRTLTEALTSHVQTAITALQFYDKLIQRLTHVREGLAIPSGCSAGSGDPGAVSRNALLEQVRARYSTVEERVLFDFMMRSLDAEQMLNALTGMRAAAVAGKFEAF